MPFRLIRGDILNIDCDVLVNPTDELLSGSGGLDRQVHMAAGTWLDLCCRELAPLPAGKAVITQGYELNKSIIHTVAPWYTGEAIEIEQLRNCYRNSLALAESLRAQSIALPLVGTGFRGFPKSLVLEIANEEIGRFLKHNEDCCITLVVHDMTQLDPGRRHIMAIRRRHGGNYFSTPAFFEADSAFAPMASEADLPAKTLAPSSDEHTVFDAAPRHCQPAPDIQCDSSPGGELSNSLSFPSISFPCFDPEEGYTLDESFSQMVLRKIDEKGIKDSECYHRANMDRRVFSKLRSDANYSPSKTTAVALAIALELNMEDTKDLLQKAGFSLSHSKLFDVIIEYCISEKIYDIFLVNELLFKFDQVLL